MAIRERELLARVTRRVADIVMTTRPQLPLRLGKHFRL
jgi:hypothetical protein